MIQCPKIKSFEIRVFQLSKSFNQRKLPVIRYLYICACRVVPADERLQRYERVVTMSLYGLSLTLHRVPVQFVADRLSEWEEFVAEKRLWKLARHQNPYVSCTCRAECCYMYIHACLFVWVMVGWVTLPFCFVFPHIHVHVCMTLLASFFLNSAYLINMYGT